jgi:hypothetical protein
MSKEVKLIDGFIIHSKDWGVYLGNCIGLGFWSELDACGQAEAVTFPTKESAEKHVAEWETQPPADTTYIPIKTTKDYCATIAECVSVGVDVWLPDGIPKILN